MVGLRQSLGLLYWGALVHITELSHLGQGDQPVSAFFSHFDGAAGKEVVKTCRGARCWPRITHWRKE